VTGGWQNTDNIALAGRTGDGKTYLALKHAHAARTSGRSVLLLSNEMGTVQIARRLVGLQTGIDPKNILRVEWGRSVIGTSKMGWQPLKKRASDLLLWWELDLYHFQAPCFGPTKAAI
jgi:replicative DNA helicase